VTRRAAILAAGCFASVAACLVVAPLRAQPSPCTVGSRVIVEPGDHPGVVLGASAASCRVHYDDGAFPDGWTYTFNIKSADQRAKDAANAAGGPRLGRYDITVGSGFYDGYLVLRSASAYELFLPGDKSAGSGTYAFDPATTRIRWISGPLTDAGWDGTQQVEADRAMMKIRIGARAVATNKGP
jgi:hypothetical protein